MHKKKRSKIVFLLGILFLINGIGSRFYKRFDLTSDKRYTLAKKTDTILRAIDKRTIIKVYLEGDFPAEFKRLQIETRQFLEELTAVNSNIRFQFVRPDAFREKLVNRGMTPSVLTVEENGKLSEQILFPWAEIIYQNKREIVSLLSQEAGAYTQEQQLQNAVENLEFALVSALRNILQKKRKKIAVLKGNGELEDIYLYSLLKDISKQYSLAKFSLDSVAAHPQKTLKELLAFDLAILAKPTRKFSEEEKFTLDQFVVNGGKTLWMLDNVQADQDSLFANGKMLAYPRDLNLTDLLFHYGVRIHTSLVKDVYAAKIALATGKVGSQTQFQNLPWVYHPLVQGNRNHPITKHIAPVRLQFASPIDTLKNDLKKTPLLKSSVLSSNVGTPSFVALESIAEPPDKVAYNKGSQLFAVLLEGSFPSAYKNRIKPFKTPLLKTKSEKNKMLVISDGDIARNQLIQGKPFDVSTDKWTGETFGNKVFLVNAIAYLLDDDALFEIKKKALKIRMLDREKIFRERGFWQFFNVLLPLFLLLLFGLFFSYARKKKYQ